MVDPGKARAAPAQPMPASARSVRTQPAIAPVSLSTAHEQIALHGREVRVHEITKAAGVGVGTFYLLLLACAPCDEDAHTRARWLSLVLFGIGASGEPNS